MDEQMTYTNFSGCQDLRGGVKSQVFHSRNQLNPARVSNPATRTKLCQNLAPIVLSQDLPGSFC